MFLFVNVMSFLHCFNRRIGLVQTLVQIYLNQGTIFLGVRRVLAGQQAVNTGALRRYD